MSKPFNISVAIPTYYRPHYLIQTINEVLNQNHPAVIEILVTDQSPKEIYSAEQWDQLKQWIHNETIIYQFQKTANANAARNRCIAKATGEIILLLDDDVLLPENFIAAHYNCYENLFQDKQTIVAVAGKSYHRTKVKEKLVDHIDLNNFQTYTTSDFKEYSAGLHPLAADDTLVGCNMSFLKSAALAVRGFDENFASYYDEADFCFRLKKQLSKSQIIIACPDAYLIHLRAHGGGHEVVTVHSEKELKMILSYNLFAIRHFSSGRMIFKLIKNLRVGPFRKENVLNVKRFFLSLFSYFKSIFLAIQLRKKVESIFK